MPFKDLPEGQTHSYNDGCPEHITMPKNKEQAPTCVQCLKEMPYGTDGDKFVSVCVRKECRNYGLLAMSKEKMEKFKK